MAPQIWAQVHGATVHFPIALTFLSVVCDTVGAMCWTSERGARFRHAAAVSLFVGAASTIPVIVSGLVMTHGEFWGSGNLRMHHLYVWPASALLVTSASVRALAGRRFSRKIFCTYLAVVYVSAALLAGAGKWGGELLQSFP